MLIIYPAIIHFEDGAYWSEFPDLKGCFSSGDTIEEIIVNSQESLTVHTEVLLEKGTALPTPTNIKDIHVEKDSFTTLISVDLSKFLNRAKTVKKTLTIPSWLNDIAMRENVNFSGILQNALIEQLHLTNQ